MWKSLSKLIAAALAALIARGLRYYGLAWLVKRYGKRVETLWKRHALKTSLALGSAVLVIVLVMQTLAGMIV